MVKTHSLTQFPTPLTTCLGQLVLGQKRHYQLTTAESGIREEVIEYGNDVN